MIFEHINGFGKVYHTIEYDPTNKWVYSNWIGHQTYIGIMAGADSGLHLLEEHNCTLLLNDNREVVGPWDHAVEWIVSNWAPRAIALGLTHFANVVSRESMAALSADAMQLGLNGQLQMRSFGDIDQAKAWLRAANRTTGN